MATTNTASTAKKKTTGATDAAKIAAAAKKDAEIEALKKQNELLQKLLEAYQSGNQAPAQAAPADKRSSMYDEVTIVHLFERAPGLSTHIELTNLSMDLHAFGETRTIERRQAEELAGKYRKLFENGTLAFGADDDDIAARFALKSVNAYSYDKTNFVEKLGTLNPIELESLYKKLGQEQRRFIVEYFKRKIIEGDTNFSDVHKVETLNRLSNRSMEGTLLDLKTKEE